MIIYSAHVRMRQSYYTYDEERDACARRGILRDISDAYLHSHNFLEMRTGKNINKGVWGCGCDPSYDICCILCVSCAEQFRTLVVTLWSFGLSINPKSGGVVLVVVVVVVGHLKGIFHCRAAARSLRRGIFSVEKVNWIC